MAEKKSEGCVSRRGVSRCLSSRFEKRERRAVGPARRYGPDGLRVVYGGDLDVRSRRRRTVHHAVHERQHAVELVVDVRQRRRRQTEGRDAHQAAEGAPARHRAHSRALRLDGLLLLLLLLLLRRGRAKVRFRFFGRKSESIETPRGVVPRERKPRRRLPRRGRKRLEGARRRRRARRSGRTCRIGGLDDATRSTRARGDVTRRARASPSSRRSPEKKSAGFSGGGFRTVSALEARVVVTARVPDLRATRASVGRRTATRELVAARDMLG